VQAQAIENNSPKVRSIRTLKQWIQQGQLPAGEQLPAENELARLLDVSRTTVRAAVKSLEEEDLLRYNQNRRRIVVGTAQRKSGFVSETVVILTHLPEKPPGGNPLQSQTGWERYIQIGLIEAIREAGMHALTVQVDLLRSDLIKSLVTENPRGLVVMRPSLHPSASLELAITLRDLRIPVVFYGYTDLAKFDTVTSDSAAGCYDLTKWLVSTGRRRLLRVWPSVTNGDIPEWRRHRCTGFEQAIAEEGLELLPEANFPNLWDPLIDTRENFEMRVRLMVGYLFSHLNGPNPVDALVALTDGDCYVLAAACRMLGKEPNRDISIVGYDNYWKDSPDRKWEPTPPLATVDKLNIKLGYELMTLLKARMDGSLPPEPQIHMIKPELQVIDASRAD
jgi:DNA-binding LacI/PurR family transcriptional regulator